MELNGKVLSDEWEDGVVKEKIAAKVTDRILRAHGVVLERTESKKDQVIGIDFRVPQYKNDPLLVDEKAAVSCWNRDLQTYTMEVYHGGHKDYLGWFNAEHFKTTHYLFVYLRADDDSLKNIWKWEGLLINKKLLQLYVSFLGNILEDVKEIVDWSKISKKKDFVFRLYYEGEDDFANLIFSNKFEWPVINLQLAKPFLMKLSRRRILWECKDGTTTNINEYNYAEIPQETLEHLKAYQERYDEMIADLKAKFESMPVVS